MLPLRRILCPVDFSDASHHAVEHALALARWYGARVTALHVSYQAEERDVSLSGTGHASERPEVQRLIEELAQAFGAGHGMGVGVDPFVRAGDPVGQILESAVTLSADLIVMGTHGSGGFEHLVLGSVAEKVLRKARCPVFTVPPKARATSVLPFKRLLCGVDFSPSSDLALQFAFSLAQQSQAELTLVHVLEWPWHEPPAPVFEDLPYEQAVQLAAFRQQREQQAMDRLTALIPDAVRDWCLPETQVAHGKPYVEMLRVAAACQADLIVLGVQGRHAFDLALLGSTTNQLVRQATCPVLTVRR